MTELQDKEEIKQVLNRYARACDSKDWSLFRQVFVADATGVFGTEFTAEDRDTIIGVIEMNLSNCGATQHLLGNHEIVIEGDTASSVCYVRAIHVGLGELNDTFFEIWGEYIDQLKRTEDGWRVTQRELRVQQEIGDRKVLGLE